MIIWELVSLLLNQKIVSGIGFFKVLCNRSGDGKTRQFFFLLFGFQRAPFTLSNAKFILSKNARDTVSKNANQCWCIVHLKNYCVCVHTRQGKNMHYMYVRVHACGVYVH